eukprot:5913021-Prymnesium_polylepis.1
MSGLNTDQVLFAVPACPPLPTFTPTASCSRACFCGTATVRCSRRSQAPQEDARRYSAARASLSPARASLHRRRS